MTLFYEITVEPVPPGTWTVHQVVPRETGRLLHSSTYEDEHAVTLVRQWITARGFSPATDARNSNA